jgi:hypothetical protein
MKFIPLLAKDVTKKQGVSEQLKLRLLLHTFKWIFLYLYIYLLTCLLRIKFNTLLGKKIREALRSSNILRRHSI